MLAMLIAASVVTLIVLAAFAVPNRVEYTEEISVDDEVSAVYDRIRFQRDLMLWSAWPSTTGSTCSVEGNDGQVGARTVFFNKKGERFGYQEVMSTRENEYVDFELFGGGGPPHKATMRFQLIPEGPKRTRVKLHFVNTIQRPFPIPVQLAGFVKWTREMHVKDLNGLKHYSEPPYVTFTGEPARK